jgi:hypothetical protein
VIVDRDLLDCEGHLLYAGRFPHRVGSAIRSLSLVQWDPAAQIRQIKSLLTITAVCGPYQLKQNFVFRDWEGLSVTKHPAGRWKITGKHPNFADVGHTASLRQACYEIY